MRPGGRSTPGWERWAEFDAASVDAAWPGLLAEESERFKVQLLPVPRLTRAVRDLVWRDEANVLRPVDPLMGRYLQSL